jgi:hypothetical protein
MKTIFRSFILTVLFGAMSSAALAEKMNSETQNMVIERLEQIIKDMGAHDSSLNPSRLRLADLLAERARLRFMNEIEVSCKGCKGSVADREKALKLYQSVFPHFQAQIQGVILFQMAHLYDIAGQGQKAASLYLGILKNPKKYSPEMITATRSALADLYFQQGNYKQSLYLYNLVSRDPKADQKALVQYRIAWCHFNLGALKTAIRTLEKLANKPELMTKNTTAGVVLDDGFRQDVLQDLATFYSRRAVTDQDITSFQRLTPDAIKKVMLLNFAQEVDRLGQKQAAAKIYHIYLDRKDLSREERLDGMVQLAQVNYENNDSAQSIDDFAVAAKEFKRGDCDEDQKCQELQKRMKKFVTDLHRSKKTRLNENVLKAYEIYAKTFPKDTEMVILGAQVAVDIKENDKAQNLYAFAADNSKDGKLRETALLGEIDAAERSKNFNVKIAAYKHYLSLNSKGEKAFEVRYQLAQVSYDQKKYSDSADQFRDLAEDKSGRYDLRKKSADLALDSLALQQKDEVLEKWAADFANLLPKHKNEFLKISRKAMERQIVKVANDPSSSSSELRSALNKIKSANTSGADLNEKSTYFKNMAVLADRSGDEAALMASLNGQLAMKNLSAKDREAILARQVGIYEKKMDFKSAYVVALKMKFPGVKNSQRELKLGTLADLANLSPRKHYERALSSGLVGPQEASVRERLILSARSPVKELKKHEYPLRRHPLVLADIVLAIYATNRSTQGLDKVMSRKEIRNLPAISFIQKQPFFGRHIAIENRVSKHHLDTRNDKTLAKSIQQRLNLLSEADRSLSNAIGLKDFTAQIMALNTVAIENQRFTEELMKTPVPKGLNPKETQKYTNMLKAQARPFLLKAKVAAGKVNEMWKRGSSWQVLTRDIAKARPSVVPLLSKEIQILIRLAPTSEIRNALEDSLNIGTLSQADLNSARSYVRSNPNDLKAIEKLKMLETKHGHALMASYLEGRLIHAQKENTL